MAKSDDTFGIEDLQKAFNKIEKKYESKVDALLVGMSNVTRARIRAKTPTNKTKKLKGSWRTKKPKTYGKARVARVQTENRYGHVVEEGHKIVTGGSTVGSNGRSLNALGRRVRGVSVGGRTQCKNMISDTVKELRSAFGKDVKKLLDELTKEVEL